MKLAIQQLNYVCYKASTKMWAVNLGSLEYHITGY